MMKPSNGESNTANQKEILIKNIKCFIFTDSKCQKSIDGSYDSYC